MNVEGGNKPPCLCFINSVKQVERVMDSDRSRQSAASLVGAAGAWVREDSATACHWKFTWSEPSQDPDMRPREGK